MFTVYILTNDRRTVLYIGVCRDLDRRLAAHRTGAGSRFVWKYNVFGLVWREDFQRVDDAIATEKRLKGWRRSKKVALIEASNPTWRDLSA